MLIFTKTLKTLRRTKNKLFILYMINLRMTKKYLEKRIMYYNL